MDAFTAMAAALQGAPLRPASAEDKLIEAVSILRASDSPAAVEVADALARRLNEGGNLETLLGLNVRRGGAFEAVHRKRQFAHRDTLLRALADELPGSTKARAGQLAHMLKTGHPKTAVFHQLPIATPTSASHLKTILRGR